ncbi:MAG: efflux RND transporter periplasmic adaptor subunit [Halomonadaceae bacterium]|nr:MAG: efflux RND transporter periplasmic adaptor subunit [Halomonadaceae bacterium]
MIRQHIHQSSNQRVLSRPSTYWSLLLFAALLTGCGSGDDAGQQGGDMPPPPVTVATMERTSVDVNEDYAGRIRGAREVEVRVRVEGVLNERLYQEGQLVEKGDSLFQIAPEPFDVSVRAAEAQKQTAQADLNQSQREWDRVSRLYDQNAVSERERDTALSALELSQAAMAVAEAEVSRTRLLLSYTNVIAPVSGVTSLETLSEGSLLDAGTMVTQITQLDPVHVRFALPEQDATVQRQARLAREGNEDNDPVRKGTLILPGGEAYEHSGEIDFTASTIDAMTGTVTARAVFANPDQQLVPGQFVRVRVTLETLDDVILVAEEAISDGPDGLQVYVLDEDNRANSRGVKTGRVIDGKRVILEGLERGDRVVVNGTAGIQQDGMEVEAFDSEEALEEAREEQEAEAEAMDPDEDAGEEG